MLTRLARAAPAGTGSELVMAVEAAKKLEGEGKKVRVVSMPCWELFEEQSQEYKDSVLLPEVKARVSVEAGSTFGWEKWVGDKGRSIGINEFGASAPGPLLYEKFGITVSAAAGRQHDGRHRRRGSSRAARQCARRGRQAA